MAKEEARHEAAQRDFSDRYKRRRYCDLHTADLVGIRHAVCVQHRFYRDIAEEFRVSVGLVSRVARKAGLDFVGERKEKEEREVDDQRRIATTVAQLLNRRGYVGSAAEVRRSVQASLPRRISMKRVRRIMRVDLGLKFKRAKPIAARTNTVCCRYQRQQFALRLIAEMSAGKRVINIDEASLSQTNFVRRGWGQKTLDLRPQAKPLGHRLTLIAALDNLGASYFAITQSTVDSEIFGAFLQRFAGQLDGEDPNWRETTILVLDGATTHRSEETCRAMAALQIPAMIAGPYGFDGSPAEKLFALLKVGDLNPGDIKTGKR